MNIKEFHKFLESVTESIDNNGEIPYVQRLAIHNKLKEFSKEHQPTNMIWKTLELICARKVLPIWLEYFPNENNPIEILDKAEKQLFEGKEFEDSTMLMAELKAYLDGKFDLGEKFFRAIYSGFACWAASGSILFDIECIEAESELELEPDDWNASFIASLAYSGGAVWEESVGDSKKRREYWLWFLNKAIPEALEKCGYKSRGV